MIIIASSSTIAQQPFPDSIKSGMAVVVEEFKNEIHAPGIAVAIFQDTTIIFEHSSGFTDSGRHVPVTVDSKFPIMSVTKMFTATLLMQLVEQKKVRLEDPVKKYVPEYPVSETSLFQLATHTSGLPRNTPAQYPFSVAFDRWMLGDKNKDAMSLLPTNAAMLKSLQHVRLEYPPFDFVHHNDRHYSNLGYSLLGIALERASKMDFQQLVNRNILQPLGMTGSGCLNDNAPDASVAAGFRWDTLTRSLEYVPIFRPHSALYAGGIYSTARDLVRFTSAQVNDQNAMLQPGSRAKMRSQKIGWKQAYPYVLHEGAMPGYRSIIVVNPVTKIGWVILCNVQDVDFNKINDRLAKVSSKVLDKKINVPKERFAGKFTIAGGYATLTISIKNDSIYSDYLRDMLGDVPMGQEGPLVFTVKGKTGHVIRYEFVVDKDGSVNAMKMGQYVWERE